MTSWRYVFFSLLNGSDVSWASVYWQVAPQVGLTCGYGWRCGVCGALCRNHANASGTYFNIDTRTKRQSQLMSIPGYFLPSQSIEHLQLALSTCSRCSVCLWPTYFTCKSSTQSVKEMVLVMRPQGPGDSGLCWYPCLFSCCSNSCCASMPACGRPYIPFCILMYTLPPSSDILVRSYMPKNSCDRSFSSFTCTLAVPLEY